MTENTKFVDLGLSPDLLKAIMEMGFETATEIQAKTIPLIMTGKDVIGKSHTGTGKTVAFGVPAVEKAEAKAGTQVLILCPTRELAMQASEEMRKLTMFKEGIKCVAVYGGQPISYQIPLLKRGMEIVIGTPGRIMDHINRKTLKLDRIKMVILDEADEMLNMGFREDIETILSFVPNERQTILFSATMPKAIMEITNLYQNDPTLVSAGDSAKKTIHTVEQYYLDVPLGKKMDALNLLLHTHEPKLSIIFCNTKKMVDELAVYLTDHGFRTSSLHGDMKQEARTRVMENFKTGKAPILIATDVAARGIDVDNVDAVYNFDVPQDFEYYVHRIGRTGRAGKKGASYTLISGRKQQFQMRDIEYYTKATITKQELPQSEDIIKRKQFNLLNEIKEIIDSPDDKFDCKNIILQLEEMGYDSEIIASSLLSMLLRKAVIKVPKIVIAKTAPMDGSRRPQQQQQGSSQPQSGYGRIRLGVGRAHNVAANHIVSALAQHSGIDGKNIGKIQVFNEYSLVDVPVALVGKVISGASGQKINGNFTDVRSYETRDDSRGRGGRNDNFRNDRRPDNRRNDNRRDGKPSYPPRDSKPQKRKSDFSRFEPQ